MYFECLRSTVHSHLFGAIAVAVGAEGVLDAQAGELRATVVKQHLGVVGSAKVRVAVDAVVVVQERDRLAEKVALLVDAASALELKRVSVYTLKHEDFFAMVVFLPLTSVTQTGRPPAMEQTLLM